MRKLCDRSPPTRAVMFLAVVGCALLMTATSASAVMIDDFSTGSFGGQIIANSGTPQVIKNQPGPLAGTISGTRDTTLNYVSGGGSVRAEVLTTGAGTFRFDLNGEDLGNVLLEYGIDDAVVGYNSATHDLNVNLAPGGELGIMLSQLDSGVQDTADITLTLRSNGTTTSSTVSGVPYGVQSIWWSFAGDFPLITLASVDYVAVYIDGKKGADYQYDFLSSAIPEPLTMLGMFAGIAGIGGYLRKRRRA